MKGGREKSGRGEGEEMGTWMEGRRATWLEFNGGVAGRRASLRFKKGTAGTG